MTSHTHPDRTVNSGLLQVAYTPMIGLARLLAVIACLLAPVAAGAQITLDRWQVQSSFRSQPVSEAIRHFQERVSALGGVSAKNLGHGEAGTSIVVAKDATDSAFAALSGFQRDESYLIEAESPGRLLVSAATAMGAIYGISDLETRLRAKGGGVRLAFPEWKEGGGRRRFEKPAIASRGEYLNIGYNLPGITPHEWDDSRWHWYIDRLLLARLNRWYFFLWIDSQSMFPGSTLSRQPGNLRLHEGVREAIRYAHKRGIKVTFMITPTMLPHDIWKTHPEWKADIDYARNGFACACPNAPGSWGQMKAVWQAEMDWFREADAVHVWFYDPGGCWCEKNGCRRHQAESLARQVREFGAMFRQANPGADVEYNLWPVLLWEQEMKVKVREDLANHVRAEAAKHPRPVTAVGTPDGWPAPIPDFERGLGMRTGVFLFATNPESSYVFPTPHLQYLRRTMQTVRKLGVDTCFGHRLEAGTRDSGTFLMGQWMWNPDLPAGEVVRRFSEWQTADESAGGRLAEAMAVLDTITDKGIRPDLGRKLEALLGDLLTHLPPPCRDDLEYWPAAALALRVIGESEGATGAELDACAGQFGKALATSKAFAPLVPRARQLFSSYRAMLQKGWEKEVF